jgi:hypothetical protein
MPPEDILDDLAQIDVPEVASSEEEHVSPRDADLLNSLRVASPCDASWEEMEGDDLVRFCQHCRKNVYNLSGMSPREAAEFVRQAEGRLCVRFYRRHDGTLLTDNCPVGRQVTHRMKSAGEVVSACVEVASFYGAIAGALYGFAAMPAPILGVVGMPFGAIAGACGGAIAALIGGHAMQRPGLISHAVLVWTLSGFIGGMVTHLCIPPSWYSRSSVSFSRRSGMIPGSGFQVC